MSWLSKVFRGSPDDAGGKGAGKSPGKDAGPGASGSPAAAGDGVASSAPDAAAAGPTGHEGIDALAASLPARSAAWWAVQSCRRLDARLSPAERTALDAAEALLTDPRGQPISTVSAHLDDLDAVSPVAAACRAAALAAEAGLGRSPGTAVVAAATRATSELRTGTDPAARDAGVAVVEAATAAAPNVDEAVATGLAAAGGRPASMIEGGAGVTGTLAAVTAAGAVKLAAAVWAGRLDPAATQAAYAGAGADPGGDPVAGAAAGPDVVPGDGRGLSDLDAGAGPDAVAAPFLEAGRAIAAGAVPWSS